MSHDPSSSNSQSSTVVIVLVVLGGLGLVTLVCGGVLVALLLPAVQMARVTAQQASDANQLRQSALSLVTYEVTHEKLPAASDLDANGQPMHSWRDAVLPYLEQQALFDRYDSSQPWNSPANRQLLSMMPPVYRSPRGTSSVGSTDTSYVAVTGPGTAFPPGRGPLSIAEISDGPANTILVIEWPESDIPWMEPKDVDIEDVMEAFADPDGPIARQRGVNAAFADGTVRQIRADIDPQTLRALLTATGGEAIMANF